MQILHKFNPLLMHQDIHDKIVQLPQHVFFHKKIAGRNHLASIKPSLKSIWQALNCILPARPPCFFKITEASTLKEILSYSGGHPARTFFKSLMQAPYSGGMRPAPLSLQLICSKLFLSTFHQTGSAREKRFSRCFRCFCPIIQ